MRDFELTAWLGMFVGKSVPVALAERIGAAVNEATRSPEAAKVLEATGMAPETALDLDAAQAYFDSEIARFRNIASAIKLELR